MSAPLVEIADLRYRWPGDRHDTLAIERLAVLPGEHLFIQGASGSGKTTLLNLVGGVLRPSAGTVRVAGEAISTLSGTRRDRVRADHIGFVFQQFNLIPYLGPQENVLLACRFSGRRAQQAAARAGSVEAEAERLLDRLFRGDPPPSSRSVVNLSVGQQQRVAAARALIGRPEIVIADEPTSSLDHETRADFMALLFEEVEQSGATLLFVSHDPTLREPFRSTVALADLNRVNGS